MPTKKYGAIAAIILSILIAACGEVVEEQVDQPAVPGDVVEAADEAASETTTEEATEAPANEEK